MSFATLGSLIDTMETMPQDACVRIAAPLPLVPTRLVSYRGCYEDLAIAFNSTDHDLKASAFLMMLHAAVGGQKFEGWKGGAFTMSRTSNVWVAPPGVTSSARVTGVELGDRRSFPYEQTVWILYAMQWRQ